MRIDSQEISDYIEEILRGVRNGIPAGNALSSPIKFRLGLMNVGNKEGSLTVMVAAAGGSRSNQENAEIEFEVTDVTPEGIKNVALSMMAAKMKPPKRRSPGS
jgi:hypothetical protein